MFSVKKLIQNAYVRANWGKKSVKTTTTFYISRNNLVTVATVKIISLAHGTFLKSYGFISRVHLERSPWRMFGKGRLSFSSGPIRFVTR